VKIKIVIYPLSILQDFFPVVVLFSRSDHSISHFQKEQNKLLPKIERTFTKAFLLK